MTTVISGSRPSSGGRLLLAGAVGALVAVSLGIYGNVHDPASDLSITLGLQGHDHDEGLARQRGGAVRAGAARLRAVDVRAAAAPAPRRRGSAPCIASRVGSRSCFSLPVAYHCLYQLAFQDSTTRVLAHSLLGLRCSTARSPPRSSSCARTRCRESRCRSRAAWCSPLLVAAWLTSGFWFISENGFPSP